MSRSPFASTTHSKIEYNARQSAIIWDKPDRNSNEFLESTYPGDPGAPKSRVLFLRDFSTPSLLIEQGLKRNGHSVEAHQLADQLLLALESDGADVVLFDYSLPLQERLTLVRRIRDEAPDLPIILLFQSNAEQDVMIAKMEAVTECVIRDRDGAYLFKIPDLVERLNRSNTRVSSAPHRTTPSIAIEDATDRVDLSEIAKEVKGAIAFSQKAALVVLAGPDVGSVVQLDDPLVLIGRDASCRMSLKDESISRFHASIKLHSSGVVTIRDLKSTNGTYINGKQIQIEELKEGDKILLGKNTVIKYQTQDSIEKSYYDELYFSSTRDELTGIYNRRFCLEKIKTDLSYAKRHELTVSVILFDVDHFKAINDTHGHLVGDRVLSTIAKVSQATIREEDVLGRYGGEEFIVFALNTDLDGAKVLAERIRRRIEREEIPISEGISTIIRTTVSLGVASTDEDRYKDVKNMVAVADENLYRAKDSGRNCIIGSKLSSDE